MCNCSYHNCPVGFVEPTLQSTATGNIILITLIVIAISLIIKMSYDYYKERRDDKK